MPSDGNTGMFSVALSWTSECFNNICKVVDHCLDNTTNIRKNYIKHFTLSFDPESIYPLHSRSDPTSDGIAGEKA